MLMDFSLIHSRPPKYYLIQLPLNKFYFSTNLIPVLAIVLPQFELTLDKQDV